MIQLVRGNYRVHSKLPTPLSHIEGTGTYATALTHYFIKNEIYVVEVNRPERSKHRLEGKSDPLDAENAVRCD